MEMQDPQQETFSALVATRQETTEQPEDAMSTFYTQCGKPRSVDD